MEEIFRKNEEEQRVLHEKALKQEELVIDTRSMIRDETFIWNSLESIGRDRSSSNR